MHPFLPILAEATVDPEWSRNMGLWLVGALSVVSMLVTIWSSVWGKSKTEIQQPLVVEMAKEFATKDELQKVDDRVTALDESVDERFEANAKASSASREKMYLSIRATEQATAALKREAELQSQRQLLMDQKLDRLLERFADHASKTKES
jgi:hypothetical protein